MFQINPISRSPVYEQIIEQVERYVFSGILKDGDQLPSVRSLSVELSVNPNTIQKAYGELDSKGIICNVQGRGSFVTQEASEIVKEKRLGRNGEFRKLIREFKASGIKCEELVEVLKSEYDVKSETKGEQQ